MSDLLRQMLEHVPAPNAQRPGSLGIKARCHYLEFGAGRGGDSRNDISDQDGIDLRGLVACMLTVAYAEFYQGKAPGEVHLITPAPLAASALATGSIGSTVAFNGAISHVGGPIEHYNTIVDADYCPTPDSRPLRHDGLIWLSETSGRGGGPPRDAS
jgi:hypothetical protein